MTVHAPCGCTLTADHRTGERLAACQHGQWIITARLEVAYDVRAREVA